MTDDNNGDLENILEKAQTILGEIETGNERAQRALEHIQDRRREAIQVLDILQNYAKTGQEIDGSTQASLSHLKEVGREIEEIKEEGRSSVESIDSRTTESRANLIQTEIDISETEDKLKEILLNIENALFPATAAGLATAFAAVLKKKEEEEEEKSKRWLRGAGIFISAAIGLSFTWSLDSSSMDLTSFLAKFSATSMAVLGAWFCGSQYLKYQNTMEDYLYKLVLAQSMPAFIKQLENHTEELNIYLTTLTQQLLQDPLRKKHDIPTPALDLIGKTQEFFSKPKTNESRPKE